MSERTRSTGQHAVRARDSIEVRDRGNTYRIVADLPGYRVQDLDVDVKGTTVQIVVDRAGSARGGRPSRERTIRTVRVPERVDARRTRATYNDGVLRIVLEKRRSGRGRGRP